VESRQGKSERTRTIRPGESCPGCGQTLHIEEMGKLEHGMMLAWIKCSCKEYRLKDVVFALRADGKPDESRD